MKFSSRKFAMSRIIRTFTLDASVSRSLDTVVKNGLENALLLQLIKPEAILPTTAAYDEMGLSTQDYADLYDMLPAESQHIRRDASMRALLTAINLHGREHVEEIMAAVNATVARNMKDVRLASRALQPGKGLHNVSRVTEALIVLGLETLRKAAALESARSAKSDAGKSRN